MNTINLKIKQDMANLCLEDKLDQHVMCSFVYYVAGMSESVLTEFEMQRMLT